MLGKLMKYEFRATARYFLPIYGAIMAFSLLIGLRGFNENFMSALNVILPAALGLSFVGLGVMTLLMVVKRFDSNLLGDEGYLMFTLPVKVSSLIASKILTSLLWMITSSVVFILSIGFIVIRDINLREIWLILENIQVDFYLIAVFALLILMSILHFLLQVYASLGIAQGYSVAKNRILGGTLIFILISIGINTIETLGATLLAYAFGESAWFIRITEQIESNNFLTVFSTMKLVFTIALVYITIKNILFYFVTKYHLQKKLNLE